MYSCKWMRHIWDHTQSCSHTDPIKIGVFWAKTKQQLRHPMELGGKVLGLKHGLKQGLKHENIVPPLYLQLNVFFFLCHLCKTLQRNVLLKDNVFYSTLSHSIQLYSNSSHSCERLCWEGLLLVCLSVYSRASVYHQVVGLSYHICCHCRDYTIIGSRHGQVQ